MDREEGRWCPLLCKSPGWRAVPRGSGEMSRREHWEVFKYGFSDLKQSVEKAFHCIDNPWLPKVFNADFQKSFTVVFHALGALQECGSSPPLLWDAFSLSYSLQIFHSGKKKGVKKECKKKACRCKSQEWLGFSLKKGIKLCKIH